MYIFAFFPRQILAAAYGEGAYGSCRYGESCLTEASFFSKYGWAIFFLALILLALALFIWLLAARRKKRKDKSV